MTEWIEVARRGENHNVLFMDFIMRTFQENRCGQSFGTGVRFIPHHYRQWAGARWFSKKDTEQYIALLQMACDSKRILDMGLRYQDDIERTRAFAEKLTDQVIDPENRTELLRVWKTFADTAVQHWSHAYHYLFLNRFLPDRVTAAVAEKVPDLAHQTQCLLTLFARDQPTEMRQETQALLQLHERFAPHGFDVSEAQTAIRAHLKRFGHLGRYYFRAAPYNLNAIRKRLESFTLEEARQKRAELAKLTRMPEESRKIMDELGLTPEVRHWVAGIKQYAYCSNIADETYNLLVHNGQPLMKAICQALDCSRNEWVSCAEHEITDALQSGKPFSDAFKAELRQRFQDCAILLEEGRVRILFGNALNAYAHAQGIVEQTLADLHEVRGIVGSAESAQGRVAIVLASRDLNHVQKGDILVTAMTTPEFVPAMQRAAAIVTDEGGILCHAAIVSRELGIPAVVGTQHATKIFAHGQWVEVDAHQGIVKKI